MTTRNSAKTRTLGKSKKNDAATLKNLKAQAEVNFPVIVWKVEQTFANPSEDFVELIYTFPTAHGSILQNISVQLGEKRLVGLVVPAKQADNTYSDSIAEGDSAMLIEKNDFGLFTMNIGNLGPGETCLIQFESAALLEVVDDKAKIIFPTVIDTRYGNPSKQGGLGIHAQPKNSWLVEYPLELSVNLCGFAQQFQISSSTHKIKVSHGSELVVGLGETSYLDRDFELTLGNISNKRPGFVFKDPFSETEQYMSLSSFAWENTETALDSARPETLKILVDCSGSMQGARIEQAKKALHGILSSLKTNHKFTLSKFGDETHHFYNKPMKAGSASLKSAFEWIEALDADLGGTELIDAIEEISKLGEDGPTDVFLITDGEIWDGQQFIKQLKHHQVRLFVVAIGAASNSNMLISAAKATGGHTEVPYSDLHVEESALCLYKRIHSPRARLKSFTVNDNPCIWHETTLSIFKDQSIPIFSIHPNCDTESILRINVGEGKSSYEQVLTSTLDEVQNLSLCQTMARLCMTKALEELETDYESLTYTAISDVGSVTPWIQEEDLEDLAISYQLLSARTKYLVTEEREVKAEGLPKVIGVNQMQVFSLNQSKIDAYETCTGQIDRLSTGIESVDYSIPVVFRSSRSRSDITNFRPKLEVGKYPASRIEILKAKFKFDPHLRTVFDDFAITYTESEFSIPAFLRKCTEKHAIDEGLPESLLTWAKAQTKDELVLYVVLDSIFTLVKIKKQEKVLSHTQFQRGTWERNLAQVLGYIE